ncbi:hypothetical protein [Anaeromusa acidaminophila]|uniref:hypothetical protein n=1 Tax=Anaeromusa acidaminophila TaxID=81464 RepID=UPI000368792B|nr:hypothetical protein [Anaeromusa acidaminophila]
MAKIYICSCGASIVVNHDPSARESELIEKFNLEHTAPGHKMMYRHDVTPIPQGLDISNTEYVFLKEEKNNDAAMELFIDKHPSYNGWIILIRKDKKGRELIFRYECINGVYKRSKFWKGAEKIQIPRRGYNCIKNGC